MTDNKTALENMPDEIWASEIKIHGAFFTNMYVHQSEPADKTGITRYIRADLTPPTNSVKEAFKTCIPETVDEIGEWADDKNMEDAATREGVGRNSVEFITSSADKVTTSSTIDDNLLPLDAVPTEIIEAAVRLGNWFAEQNISEWKLGGVQNRVDAPTIPDDKAVEERIFQKGYERGMQDTHAELSALRIGIAAAIGLKWETVCPADETLINHIRSRHAPRCKCDIRTKLVGDGCDICNPEYAAQFAPSSEGVREALIWAKTEITHHENVCGTGTKTDDIAYLRITPNMLKTLIQCAQSSMEKNL